MFISNILNKTVSISQIFIRSDIQRLLAEITRFDDKVLFAKRQVGRLKSPKMVFMTDAQLQKAKQNAYVNVRAKMQMPPVMEPNLSSPQVICRDEDIVGYTKNKFMFVDIGPGYSNRDRLMSIRELDGTLRFPTHVERSRLNHMFFPSEHRTIDPPKFLEGDKLNNLIKKREYLFILNRACTQFEPDDTRFIEITHKVYDYIDDCSDFKSLRSTRFFGPMALYLTYNKKADNLIVEMLSKNLIDDAVKVVQIYNECHDIQLTSELKEPLKIIEHYSNSSPKKYLIDLALQASRKSTSA